MVCNNFSSDGDNEVGFVCGDFPFDGVGEVGSFSGEGEIGG